MKFKKVLAAIVALVVSASSVQNTVSNAFWFSSSKTKSKLSVANVQNNYVPVDTSSNQQSTIELSLLEKKESFSIFSNALYSKVLKEYFDLLEKAKKTVNSESFYFASQCCESTFSASLESKIGFFYDCFSFKSINNYKGKLEEFKKSINETFGKIGEKILSVEKGVLGFTSSSENKKLKEILSDVNDFKSLFENNNEQKINSSLQKIINFLIESTAKEFETNIEPLVQNKVEEMVGFLNLLLEESKEIKDSPIFNVVKKIHYVFYDKFINLNNEKYDDLSEEETEVLVNFLSTFVSDRQLFLLKGFNAGNKKLPSWFGGANLPVSYQKIIAVFLYAMTNGCNFGANNSGYFKHIKPSSFDIDKWNEGYKASIDSCDNKMFKAALKGLFDTFKNKEMSFNLQQVHSELSKNFK